MRNSSEPASRVRTRAEGRTHLAANLLILPGFGSILAGRREGWLQAVLALAGLAASAGFVTLALLAVLRSRESWSDAGSAAEVLEKVRSGPVDWRGLLWLGVGGFLAFAVAWVWGLWTSLRLLSREKQVGEEPGAPPPVL